MKQRPNLLIIMADEHAPMFSGPYGHPVVKTPNLDRLAANGVLFTHAYCNSPLCVPSRMSFMTGRYVHHIGVWDNAVPLASDAVTWAHRLGAGGYEVVLCGKQHFVGPDKLHGFHAQLGRDLHGSRLHPIFDWSEGTPAGKSWGSYLDRAGPGTSEEIEIDDETEAAAMTYLKDSARRKKPWALNVSFLAPHFPLVVPQRFWDLYPLDHVDLPHLPPGHLDGQHAVYQRMRSMFGMDQFSEQQVRRGRAGYYGLISYLDEKIGTLRNALEETDQIENTLIVYVSDHGEMAGEHGMWRKSNFYEQSVRIPLLLSWPGRLPTGRRVESVVSLVDLVATFIDVANVPHDIGPMDGRSLLPLAQRASEDWKDEAFSEYFGHGVARPMAMLRRGRYKLNYSLGDVPELYDLTQDPGEFQDLGTDPAHAEIREELSKRLLAFWDPVGLEQRVCDSQKERLLIRRSQLE